MKLPANQLSHQPLVLMATMSFIASSCAFTCPIYKNRLMPHLYESFAPLNEGGGGDDKKVTSDDAFFYDDFGEANIGNVQPNDGNPFSASANMFQSLESRMGQTRNAEAEYDAKLARNWRRGNWSVRGFALDKGQSSYTTASSTSQAVQSEEIDAALTEPSYMSNRRNVASTSGLYEEEQKPIHVSVIAAPSSAFYADISMGMPTDPSLPEERSVAVGRTDGSVFIVQLGKQYLTAFTEVPKLVIERTEIDDPSGVEEGTTEMSVQVEKEWVDLNEAMKGLAEEQMQSQIPNSEQDQPFQIIYQFQAFPTGEKIHSLVFHDIDDGSDFGSIVCSAAGESGDIHVWYGPTDYSSGGNARVSTLTGVHSDKIIALKTMVLPSNDSVLEERHVLFSASRDGSFALWDLSKNGEVIFCCQCVDVDEDATKRSVLLTCADVSNPATMDGGYDYVSNSVQSKGKDIIYLGTSDGYVIGYVVDELLSLNTKLDCPVPKMRFRAHGTSTGKGDAITAIKCGGDGTIPTSANMRGGEERRSPRMSSSILLTGGEDGSVKQWEILSQESPTGIRMEHWPRLSSQRMKRRCHLFAGHDGPVTSLAQQSAYDSSKFISCGRDGAVYVWSASSGEELFRMDGFSESISSLACLGWDLLVTDGMAEYVCVHDFDIDEDAASKGYDLEW